MTPQNPENTTAGAPAAETAPHITVEGFDSLVPVVIDLDSPRDGVPLVIETQCRTGALRGCNCSRHRPGGC